MKVGIGELRRQTWVDCQGGAEKRGQRPVAHLGDPELSM
jgi:hypothetical protein